MQARVKLADMLNLGLTPQARPQCNRETMSSGLWKKTSGMGHAVRRWRLVALGTVFVGGAEAGTACRSVAFTATGTGKAPSASWLAGLTGYLTS